MKDPQIAVLILSCDKFRATWKPCIDHLFRAWPNCPYSVYLLNNYMPSDDFRVIDLLVGQDDNWSDSLIKGLWKLKEERVFFIFDDSFISSINLNELNVVFRTALDHNFDSITLRRNPFGSGERFSSSIYKIGSNTRYRNALFLNLIRREVLLDLLKSGENAWQFEKDGNIRSRDKLFYSVYHKGICTYRHGIVKGKWLPQTYNYLKINGYTGLNDLGRHSYWRLALMEVYKFLFYGINKVFHFVR